MHVTRVQHAKCNAKKLGKGTQSALERLQNCMSLFSTSQMYEIRNIARTTEKSEEEKLHRTRQTIFPVAIDQYALPELKLRQGLGAQTTNLKANSVELVPFFEDKWENVPIFQTSDRAAMH